MLTACMLGGQFVIVTFAAALGRWFEECVHWHRLGQRCAGVRWLEGSFSSAIADVQGEKEAALVSLANQAVEEAGALGGRTRRIFVPACCLDLLAS